MTPPPAGVETPVTGENCPAWCDRREHVGDLHSGDIGDLHFRTGHLAVTLLQEDTPNAAPSVWLDVACRAAGFSGEVGLPLTPASARVLAAYLLAAANAADACTDTPRPVTPQPPVPPAVESWGCQVDAEEAALCGLRLDDDDVDGPMVVTEHAARIAAGTDDGWEL